MAAGAKAATGAEEGDRPLAGMALMVLCVGLLTVMDGTAKYLAREYPLWQVVWARYAFNLLALLLLLAGLRRRAWRTRAPGLQLTRALAMVAATFTMFLSLKLLPMAETYAIAFLSPILVAVLAGLVLRERLDAARWLAALGGFLGVLVVMRPGSGLFGPAALAPVAMALSFALYQLVTRMLGGRDGAHVTMFWSAAVGTAATGLMLPWNWVPPDLAGLLLMAAMGGIGLLGQLAMIRAFALAPASLVSPFIYTQIVWAVLFGYLVFGDLPDLWTLVGAAIVIAAGLHLFRHEARSNGQGRS